MQVRSLVAALGAALLCCAFASIPSLAQGQPAAQSAGATATQPPVATSGDNGQSATDNTQAAIPDAASPPTVVQTTPQPVAATPVVESIRTKLAGLDKTSSSDDISALSLLQRARRAAVDD